MVATLEVRVNKASQKIQKSPLRSVFSAPAGGAIAQRYLSEEGLCELI